MTPIRIRDLNKMGTHAMSQNGNGNGANIFSVAPPFFSAWPVYPRQFVAPAPFQAPVYEPIPSVAGISPLVTAAAILGGAVVLALILK